ncbi:hypothetical protein TGME49_220175 [Toxoplasma gondii ME49]|uniref:Uncharacterized protein n=1 Tax=Toxoplasma gondii (strain ATCC 50611 / Me49) TaxID=508771 RepID=S8F5L4_TOXGM|nr:hypothetical protein TGME49_220175 [Toxoplasma gondii ME49]EPT31116.1 hypothetical protein TGME49_220175 [Toxoplasma gondii ME49]|eukprot:XP_018637826.1 hypothetical protein TGME49_220175 [Toxoplasma gondii ME49]
MTAEGAGSGRRGLPRQFLQDDRLSDVSGFPSSSTSSLSPSSAGSSSVPSSSASSRPSSSSSPSTSARPARSLSSLLPPSSPSPSSPSCSLAGDADFFVTQRVEEVSPQFAVLGDAPVSLTGSTRSVEGEEEVPAGRQKEEGRRSCRACREREEGSSRREEPEEPTPASPFRQETNGQETSVREKKEQARVLNRAALYEVFQDGRSFAQMPWRVLDASQPWLLKARLSAAGEKAASMDRVEKAVDETRFASSQPSAEPSVTPGSLSFASETSTPKGEREGERKGEREGEREGERGEDGARKDGDSWALVLLLTDCRFCWGAGFTAEDLARLHQTSSPATAAYLAISTEVLPRTLYNLLISRSSTKSVSIQVVSSPCPSLSSSSPLPSSAAACSLPTASLEPECGRQLVLSALLDGILPLRFVFPLPCLPAASSLLRQQLFLPFFSLLRVYESLLFRLQTQVLSLANADCQPAAATDTHAEAKLIQQVLREIASQVSASFLVPRENPQETLAGNLHTVSEVARVPQIDLTQPLRSPPPRAASEPRVCEASPEPEAAGNARFAAFPECSRLTAAAYFATTREFLPPRCRTSFRDFRAASRTAPSTERAPKIDSESSACTEGNKNGEKDAAFPSTSSEAAASLDIQKNLLISAKKIVRRRKPEGDGPDRRRLRFATKKLTQKDGGRHRHCDEKGEY